MSEVRDTEDLDVSGDCKSLLQRFLLFGLGRLSPDRCIGGDWLDAWLAAWLAVWYQAVEIILTVKRPIPDLVRRRQSSNQLVARLYQL